MSFKLPECPSCRPIAEAAFAEGKMGYVMCVACLDRHTAENATRDATESAKSRAWRTARTLVPEEDRLVAISVALSAIMTAAERDVLRRLVCAQLPGGEVEYWGLVEQELKR